MESVTDSSFFLDEKLAWMDKFDIDHAVVLNLSQLYGNGLRVEEMKQALRFQNDFNARIIRDGTIIFNGKVGSIFREKNQVKQVNVGLECGISLKDFNDFQIKDIIEAYRSKTIEREIKETL